MTLAKGITSGYLPLSAVMVGTRVADVLWEKGGEFAHGFTYSGHPVPCAVALENIAIIEEEDLVARVREDVGPYLRQRLARSEEHTSELQSLMRISYAVFCLKKKKTLTQQHKNV